ncbi:hypothetical protein [Streptomyces sp. NPDC052225]|uniref:hypothetical protein n=1 Tax=Streptomyces sp. NPDC052225 TaxID=3154949 RepID=UPI0034357A31
MRRSVFAEYAEYADADAAETAGAETDGAGADAPHSRPVEDAEVAAGRPEFAVSAFSDEQAPARWAQARGAYRREWTYRTVLGAKLLDVAVPAAGVPCGVALDCADAPEGGTVFPPVKGIVPDAAAVDIDVIDVRDVREGDDA